MRTKSRPEPVQVGSRPLLWFVVIATTLSVALLSVAAITGLPVPAFLLVVEYVVLLGGAVLLARRSGPGAVRRLFSGVAHWKIGWINWAIVLLAMPLATIGVAALTGAYTAPDEGWLKIGTEYLFQTFIFGVVGINLAEETVWNGLVQRNLTRRRGLLTAAALTAIPFGIIHIPLSFGAGIPIGDAVFSAAVSVAVAPFMRYVVGRTDLATGGSLLAVAVFHAGFNASGKLGVVTDWWQYAVALGLIAVVLLAADTIRARSTSRPLYGSRTIGEHAPELAFSR